MSEPAHKQPPRDLATHRRARHEYTVLEVHEAGIELRGTEVKSLRGGQASLAESYVELARGEAWIRDLHIPPYPFGNQFNHEPRRPRRLLLHRREILRLQGLAATKGATLIPLRLFLRRGRIKAEVALCRGKLHADKREAIRRKTADREAAREVAARRRG